MKFTKINKIKQVSKKQKIYHLTVKNNHNYFANNLCVHNCSYRGNILIRMAYKIQPQDLFINKYNEIMTDIDKKMIYQKGDKIGQLIPMPVFKCDFQVVDELSDSERGEGSFGSTGQ